MVLFSSFEITDITGQEDDGEVFQVKKSSLSRKLALGKHPSSVASIVFEGSMVNSFPPFRSVPLNLDQATISLNDGPKYDQAYLNELKANTPSSRPSMNTEPVSVSGELDSSIQVIDVDMGMSSSTRVCVIVFTKS